MTATAAMATSHINNKLPPPAADILGTSYAGSIADSMSIMPTDDASLFNITGATSGRKSQQFQGRDFKIFGINNGHLLLNFFGHEL